jgi:hypothetical protein
MSALDQDQDTQKEEDVYFNFINSLKSEITKKIYEYYIKSFMKFCNVTKLSDLLGNLCRSNFEFVDRCLTCNGFFYYLEIFGCLNFPFLRYLNYIEIGSRMWNIIPIPKCHTPYTQLLEVIYKCVSL